MQSAKKIHATQTRQLILEWIQNMHITQTQNKQRHF
jgi:hypothetical protein